MLAIFEELDRLCSTHFYLEQPYRLDEYKTLVLQSGLSTNSFISNYNARDIYYWNKSTTVKEEIIQYIERGVALAESKEKLILFIEPIFHKLGGLKKAYSDHQQLYYSQLRSNPESEDHKRASGVYFAINHLIEDLFLKVKNTYGYLFPKKTRELYDTKLFKVHPLADIFKKKQEDDFDQWANNVRDTAHKKPTIGEAILYLHSCIQASKQAKIRYSKPPNESEENELSQYFEIDYDKEVAWLEVELESLMDYAKMFVDGDETKKQNAPMPVMKLKTKLTVSQIAMLLDLSLKEKLIEGTQTAAEDFFVAFFSSKRAEDISKVSLHNKIGQATEKEIDDLKSNLIALVNAINAIQNKNQKK